MTTRNNVTEPGSAVITRDKLGTPHLSSIKVAYPELTCPNCESPTSKLRFPPLHISEEPATVYGRTQDMPGERTPTPFRFLALPAELRNRIYDLVFACDSRTICIPGKLLRPHGLKAVPPKQCSDVAPCTGCQLRLKLDLRGAALTRACRQIHDETDLLLYIYNTFSFHNLHYLGAFLTLIGKTGRAGLRSLRFIWRMPECEGRAQSMRTDAPHIYRLLLGCTNLKKLRVEVHVWNMLTWNGAAKKRRPRAKLLNDLPGFTTVYEMRGLEDVYVAWEGGDALDYFASYARALIGCWRLPRGKRTFEARPVDAEVCVEPLNRMRSVHWRAKTAGEGQGKPEVEDDQLPSDT